MKKSYDLTLNRGLTFKDECRRVLRRSSFGTMISGMVNEWAGQIQHRLRQRILKPTRKASQIKIGSCRILMEHSAFCIANLKRYAIAIVVLPGGFII